MNLIDLIIFLALGALAGLIVAVANPFPVALSIFLAYCLGGLSFFSLHGKVAT